MKYKYRTSVCCVRANVGIGHRPVVWQTDALNYFFRIKKKQSLLTAQTPWQSGRFKIGLQSSMR